MQSLIIQQSTRFTLKNILDNNEKSNFVFSAKKNLISYVSL